MKLRILTSQDIPAIESYIRQGMNDREIGVVMGGYEKCRIYSFRTRHGIKAKIKRGRPEGFFKNTVAIKDAILKKIENGLEITVYPAGWAWGISPQLSAR